VHSPMSSPRRILPSINITNADGLLEHSKCFRSFRKSPCMSFEHFTSTSVSLILACESNLKVVDISSNSLSA